MPSSVLSLSSALLVFQHLPELAEAVVSKPNVSSSSMITFLSQIKAIPVEVLRFWPSEWVLASCFWMSSSSSSNHVIDSLLDLVSSDSFESGVEP